MRSAWNFFAPAKTVVFLKSTVFAAGPAAHDSGVCPVMCAGKGLPGGGGAAQHHPPCRASSLCSDTLTKQIQRSRQALQRAEGWEERELAGRFSA